MLSNLDLLRLHNRPLLCGFIVNLLLGFIKTIDFPLSHQLGGSAGKRSIAFLCFYLQCRRLSNTTRCLAEGFNDYIDKEKKQYFSQFTRKTTEIWYNLSA